MIPESTEALLVQIFVSIGAILTIIFSTIFLYYVWRGGISSFLFKMYTIQGFANLLFGITTVTFVLIIQDITDDDLKAKDSFFQIGSTFAIGFSSNFSAIYSAHIPAYFYSVAVKGAFSFVNHYSKILFFSVIVAFIPPCFVAFSEEHEIKLTGGFIVTLTELSLVLILALFFYAKLYSNYAYRHLKVFPIMLIFIWGPAAIYSSFDLVNREYNLKAGWQWLLFSLYLPHLTVVKAIGMINYYMYRGAILMNYYQNKKRRLIEKIHSQSAQHSNGSRSGESTIVEKTQEDIYRELHEDTKYYDKNNSVDPSTPLLY